MRETSSASCARERVLHNSEKSVSVASGTRACGGSTGVARHVRNERASRRHFITSKRTEAGQDGGFVLSLSIGCV